MKKWLIDANAFGMYLADVQLTNRGLKDDFCEFLDDIMDALNDFPAVDAVEVVRCKDCIHWCDCKVMLSDGTYRDYLPGEAFGDVTLDNGINVSSHCTLHGYEDSSGSWFWARPDDFCSRGERRTNE